MRKLLLLLVMIVSYACPSMAATIGDVYTKVTSGDQLATGNEYVLVYTETGSKYYAMGAISGKYFACVKDAYDLSEDGNTLTIKSAAVQEFTLVNGTKDGTFAFMFTGSDNAQSYMQCTGTANNNMGTNTKLVANCNMSITVNQNGNATIIPTNNSNSNNNKFQCNANNSQERFSNYKTGSQKAPTFYVKTKLSNVEKPVISIANAKVSITTETEGATIYYTTDGTTPDNNSTKYEAEFDVVPATTYMAIAEKDGEYSSVATKISSAACGEIVFNPSESAVEKGTEVTVSAENASSFVYSVIDADANYLVEDAIVEGSSFTYIVNQECSISVTPSNADGVVGIEAMASYTLKAAAPCGVVTFNPAAGEVLEGTEVTISAENATSYKYFVLDAEYNNLVAETIVNAATFTYVVNEDCTIDVIPYNVDNVPGAETESEYTIKERVGVTHNINGLSFGTKGTSYAEYTYTADDVIYLARANGAYASGESQSKVTANFGIRTSDGSSVVVSSKPLNWVAKSIKITQYKEQTTAKTAVIYGSDKPFESANKKVSELTDAVEIGRADMQNGVAVAIDICEFPYIAIYSSDGALQIEDIEIVWDKPEVPEMATILVDEQPISGNSVSLDGKEKVVVTFSHAHPLATFWYKHTSPAEQENVNGFARVSEGFTQVKPNADNKYAVEITDAGRFEYFTHLNGIETEHNYMDFTGQTTGVEDVIVEQDQNAEYFDLTGRRVLNPASGLYIKVVGGKATKTYIR